MIGERLKRARTKAGHTQASLAELVNTNARQIWRWEAEENEPEGDKVALLAQYLNVSSDYLLGLTDDPTPSDKKASNLSPMEKSIIAAYREGNIKQILRLIASEE